VLLRFDGAGRSSPDWASAALVADWLYCTRSPALVAFRSTSSASPELHDPAKYKSVMSSRPVASVTLAK
jgi:hypothetical protein